MGYAVNLERAKQAVEHVRKAMALGASNKVGDALRSTGMSILCVAAQRSVEVAITAREGVPAWIVEAAAKSEHVGCGNCGEQAAIAFMYLLDTLKVEPLDYMVRTNADHAFVVVGRKAGSKESDFKTWGGDCIVCDPWAGAAFAASDIPKKAYKGSGFLAESLCRWG